MTDHCPKKPQNYNHIYEVCIQMNPIPIDSIVFYDAIVLLGTPGANQTQKAVRVVGYRFDNVDYRVATDRRDLAAEQIAFIYKLRWQIEKFFAWWKRHLKSINLSQEQSKGRWCRSSRDLSPICCSPSITITLPGKGLHQSRGFTPSVLKFIVKLFQFC